MKFGTHMYRVKTHKKVSWTHTLTPTVNNEILEVYVSSPDAQKHHLDPYPKSNRKSAILGKMLNFGEFYGHFQASYFNELVLGISSDQLQICSETS